MGLERGLSLSNAVFGTCEINASIIIPLQLFLNILIQLFISGCYQRSYHSYWYWHRNTPIKQATNKHRIILVIVEKIKVWDWWGNGWYQSGEGSQEASSLQIVFLGWCEEDNSTNTFLLLLLFSFIQFMGGEWDCWIHFHEILI